MITVFPCIDKSANNDISPLASQMTVLKTPGVLFLAHLVKSTYFGKRLIMTAIEGSVIRSPRVSSAGDFPVDFGAP